MPSRRTTRIFTIFNQLADLTEDRLWKILLQECASGKFPGKIRYTEKNNTLIYRPKSTKTIIYQLPIEPSVFELDKLISFFRNEVGIYLNFDKDDSKGTVVKEQKLAELLKIQDLFLTKLNSYLHQAYNDDKKIKKLYFFLVLRYFFGDFGPKNMIIENEIITGIKGLIEEKDGSFRIVNNQKSEISEETPEVSELSFRPVEKKR